MGLRIIGGVFEDINSCMCMKSKQTLAGVDTECIHWCILFLNMRELQRIQRIRYRGLTKDTLSWPQSKAKMRREKSTDPRLDDPIKRVEGEERCQSEQLQK